MHNRSNDIILSMFLLIHINKLFLKFFVVNIAHNTYLGQPWLTSNGIEVDWPAVNVHVKPDITIQGIQKKEKQLSLMSTSQLNKIIWKEQAFLAVLQSQEPDTDKNKPPHIDPKVQDILNEYTNVFPNDLLKSLPPKWLIDHCIDLLPNSAPVAKPTYKMPLTEMDELCQQLDDVLRLYPSKFLTL